MPSDAEALPGRPDRPFTISDLHTVLGTHLDGPIASGYESAVFGMGCFWGAERIFWQLEGVYSTAVGYSGGSTPNPTYEEVCSGRTGHAETVRVVFNPDKISYVDLLKTFWESHDPTQGHRQGADVGTQYRSVIEYSSQAQRDAAEASRAMYADELKRAGHGPITTEIVPAREFYYAEPYHQQYLSSAKNPDGYCGIGGTGVTCPIGIAKVNRNESGVSAENS